MRANPSEIAGGLDYLAYFFEQPVKYSWNFKEEGDSGLSGRALLHLRY